MSSSTGSDLLELRHVDEAIPIAVKFGDNLTELVPRHLDADSLQGVAQLRQGDLPVAILIQLRTIRDTEITIITLGGWHFLD